MIPYISCLRVRELLDEFVDGELSVEEQVAVESHLHSCAECSLATRDLALIGQALRAVGTQRAAALPEQMSGMRAAVVERVQAELDQSLPRRVGRLFEDMHLVWPALGASVATIACVVVATGVLHAAQPESPDSLAGIIEGLANPVRAEATVSTPRGIPDDVVELTGMRQMNEEDAVFALANVVTREGRIANLEWLLSGRAGVRSGDESATELLNAMARARFEPAQIGGTSVAVRKVWLLTHTTVRANNRLDAIPAPWNPLGDLSPAPRPKVGTEGRLRDRVGITTA